MNPWKQSNYMRQREKRRCHIKNNCFIELPNLSASYSPSVKQVKSLAESRKLLKFKMQSSSCRLRGHFSPSPPHPLSWNSEWKTIWEDEERMRRGVNILLHEENWDLWAKRHRLRLFLQIPAQDTPYPRSFQHVELNRPCHQPTPPHSLTLCLFPTPLPRSSFPLQNCTLRTSE